MVVRRDGSVDEALTSGGLCDAPRSSPSTFVTSYMSPAFEEEVAEDAPLLSKLAAEEPDENSARSGITISTFNLINAVVGAGILSLPYAFSLTGYAGGLLVLVFNVFAADYAIRLLMKSAEVTQRRSYEGVAEAAFGKPGVIVISVCTILLNLGATIAYYVIIGDVLPELIHDAAPHFLDESWARAWCTGVITMAVLLPITLRRSVAGLAITSTMAMICVLIVVVTLVALAASGRQKDDYAPDAEPPRAFIASTDFFRAFSVMAFAFTCHTVAFPVYLELERPSVARMMKVTHSGMGIALALYSTLAVAGYFEYSQTTGGVEGDVLVNMGQSEAKAVSIVVRIAFVVSIIGTFPLCLVPIRQSLAGLIFGGLHPTAWPVGRHVAITLLVMGPTLCAAIFLPVLDFVFGVTGATAGVTVVYIMPAVMTLKLRWNTLKLWERVLIITMALFGAGIGVLSTIFTVLDHIEGDD